MTLRQNRVNSTASAWEALLDMIRTIPELLQLESTVLGFAFSLVAKEVWS